MTSPVENAGSGCAAALDAERYLAAHHDDLTPSDPNPRSNQ
jgi:hypothetical protein